jgi:hypothetical protein
MGNLPLARNCPGACGSTCGARCGPNPAPCREIWAKLMNSRCSPVKPSIADLRSAPFVNARRLASQAQKTERDFPMADARCSCGALTLTLPEPSKLVVACHCLDCQRRTGAPFGVGAFYPVDVVAISGTAKEFTRDAASGGKVHSYFCPNCGSTIYWRADNLPSLIGVAVGALADPKYPAPVRSIFEQSKHDWVQIDGAVEHFQQSSLAKKSN